MELFRRIGKLFSALLGRASESPAEITEPPPPPKARAVTLELVGLSGHGKTTFTWALFAALRELHRAWPSLLQWPLDTRLEAEAESENGNSSASVSSSLEQALLGFLDRRLPERGTSPVFHRSNLRSLIRWGEKAVEYWDGSDSVFGHEETTDFNWGVPVLWALAWSDLVPSDRGVVDLRLQQLLTARERSGWAPHRPLQLIVMITKADTLTDLPSRLREELKSDPVARWFRSGEAQPVPFDLSVHLDRMRQMDESIRRWLGQSLEGDLFLARAAAHHVDLRFCLVSATGSGLLVEGRMLVPWVPHGVLDPLFWAFELSTRGPESVV